MIDEGIPFSTARLNVDGREIIALGYPNTSVGKVKEKLLYALFEGKVANESGALLEYARRLKKSGFR